MKMTADFKLFGSGTTSIFNQWSSPSFIEAIEVGETIEMIYKQTSRVTYTIHPAPLPEVRVFKIVYSCIDGKWNKSEPIFGKTVSSRSEYFEFNE